MRDNSQYIGCKVTFKKAEGGFAGVCASHQLTGVTIASAIGRMVDDPPQSEPWYSDVPSQADRQHDFLTHVQLTCSKALVWNLSQLDYIPVMALARLKDVHAALLRKGRPILMVLSPELNPVLHYNHLLTMCEQAQTVPEAMLKAYMLVAESTAAPSKEPDPPRAGRGPDL